MTTVSAEAKLIPKPPALVDSRKQKSYHTDARFNMHHTRGNILFKNSFRLLTAAM